MRRRSFLGSILALGVAPAFVRASSLMPVFARSESGLIVPRESFYGEMVRKLTIGDLDLTAYGDKLYVALHTSAQSFDISLHPGAAPAFPCREVEYKEYARLQIKRGTNGWTT